MTWLLHLLVGCLAQQATAVAQVAAPRAEHLAVHGPGRRTALHYGRSVWSTAEVGKVGEVGLHLNQDPQVIISIGDDVVFGSLMLVTPNPHIFAKDSAAQRAAQVGIERVAAAMNVREVGVSLVWSKTYPQVVRVDFDVAFRTAKGRQAFIKHVAEGGARTLVDSICRRMPPRFKGRCTLPDASLLDRDGDWSLLSLADLDEAAAAAAALPAGPQCYGNITINPEGPPQLLIEDPEWQEALALAIAEVAWVSRLQVGTLMAVVANSLRIDFWLTRRKGTCSQAAVNRITKSSIIAWRAGEHVRNWQADRNHTDFLVYGRLALDVPSLPLFAGNESVAKAVETALGQVAATPGPEALQLSVRNVSVSLATTGNLSDAVLVGLEVSFRTPRDRQVFSWNFAADGGKKLASRVNKQLPSVCGGHCRLPAEGSVEATARPPTYAELGRRFGTFVQCLTFPHRLVPDPLVHEAMAMAVSEMASIQRKQVGILVSAASECVLSTDFWVASSNMTLRQAAVLRMERAGRSKFTQCTLAQMDRLHSRVQDRAPGTVHGGFTLHVPHVQSFNVVGVRNALRSAITQVAALPLGQVRRLEVKTGLWQGSPQIVRVDFWVVANSQEQNFTRAIAGDGGEKLVAVINELVPKPFKGQCRLPVLNETEVTRVTVGSAIGMRSGDEVANITARNDLGQQYGSMSFYMFLANSYIHEKFQDAVATTIAEVASVPRSQVGVLVTAKSPSLVSVDFWVASASSTLRQAAVRRIGTNWTSSDLKLLWRRAGHVLTPIFMVSGGTVPLGLGRFKCEK